ncbi:hypothetical protein F5Y19DRAFT_477847 [Xylariaceae sp. FL1651]|nr:hypothetical protein F5Y19DRAFT_477847 [Xylariaceae sp. FL1651]
MDIVGLVLGAIPILLTGIDKYCELYGEWVKSTDLLAKRRRQLAIEHMILKQGLKNLSPDLIEEEIDRQLVICYADEHDTIVGTIMDLNNAIWKLRERMDIDETGKPRATHRVRAEWSRIKRSFKKKEVDELFNEIHRYNNNLRICFEGKREIPSDMANSITSQQKFSRKACQEMRKEVRMVHEALGSAYDKDCKNEHLNMIDLSWYHQGFKKSQILDLSFPSRDSCSQTLMCWCTTRIKFEVRPLSDKIYPTNEPKTTNQTVTSPINIPLSSKKLQKARFVTSPESASRSVSPMPAIGIVEPPSPLPIREQIQSICSTPREKLFSGYLLHPDNDEERVIVFERNKLTNEPLRVLAWRSLLADVTVPSPGLRRYQKRKISKKDRLAIASAATWAVLLLCGTPWLEETRMSGDDITLLTKDIANAQNSSESMMALPVFNYQFKPAANTNRQGCRNDEFSGVIPHVALFSLAIILLETGLGKSFKKIWEESGKPFAGFNDSDSWIEYYKVTDDAVEDLYDEMGDPYADAVRRCLKFNFPGRKSLQHFDNETLQRHFFLGVVAPVQERYEQEQTRHRIFKDDE